jgi:hypothetical protein
MVVVLFSEQLEKCLAAINKNPSIDKEVIIKVFSSLDIRDLPFDVVKENISKKTKKTDFEKKILQALADRKKKGL